MIEHLFATQKQWNFFDLEQTCKTVPLQCWERGGWTVKVFPTRCRTKVFDCLTGALP